MTQPADAASAARVARVNSLIAHAVGAPSEIGSLQAADVHRRYREGTLRVRTLVGAILNRIAARRDDHVWIELVSRKEADARAAVLDARLEELRAADAPLPPLFGIPFAVKDNIDVAGLDTTAGCPAFAYRPERTAPAVERLLEAGAVLVGKTNLDQFATGLVGTRSPYGICASPFDRAMISGGSSSGSALAVSTGLVTFSLGTDAAGSGRVPAAFGNIVGVKPSRGLVSTRGVVPACRSLDCVSVFALSVADAASVLAVVAGHDPDDPYSRRLPAPPAQPTAQAITGARLAVPLAEQLDFAGDRTAEAGFAAAVALLLDSGADIVPTDIDGFLEAGRMLHDGPWLAERYAAVGPFLREHEDDVHPVIRAVLAGGDAVTGPDVFRGMHRLRAIHGALAPLWEDVDALIVPTVPTSYRIEDVLADPVATNACLGRYTTFANLLDMAGVAVPAGFRPDGLPHGISFLGPSGQDGTLAALAALFHRATGLTVGATPYTLADLW